MTWLPRLLFLLTVGLALALLTAVLLAPFIPLTDSSHLGARVLRLFAEDSVVRRTAVAGAAGLFVTACVFFRPGKLLRTVLRKVRPNRFPPPGNIAGA